MPGSDKVGHVLKGLIDDAFNLLMCKNYAAVAAIIEECKCFELAKSRRLERSLDRFSSGFAVGSALTNVP